MKNNILIGLLTFIWLVLMVDILWCGTDGKWIVEDAEKIAKLEVAQYANQIIVVAVSDEDTKLCLYERESDGVEVKKNRSEYKDEMIECENTSWQLVLETEAIIGKNGLGKTKEGDGKTPVGVFLFVEAFGILENPEAQISYTQVKEEHYWVDDSSSKYYNQFVSTDVVTEDWSSAEQIVKYGESYHYVLATSYNLERIPGKGSAVFLHCTSNNMRATAGCIAVPEKYMREIIKRVKSGCVLIIDDEKNILSY